MKYKFVTLLLAIVLLSMSVSAFEFDNCGQYNPDTKTMKIKNACPMGIDWFADDIADITLVSPQHLEVAPGYGLVQEWHFNSKQAYTGAIKNLISFDINADKAKRDPSKWKEIDQQYDLKIKEVTNETVPTYRMECNEVEDLIQNSTNGTTYHRECEQIQNGTEVIEVVNWIDINNNGDLPKGEFNVGVFTNVDVGDYVELIPTLMGIEIEEWASWSQSLNVNITSYYKLDGTSGAVLDSVGNYNGTNVGTTRGATGKINYSFSFDGSDYVDIDDVQTALSSSTTGTFAGWIRMPDATPSGDMTIIGFGDESANEYLYFNIFSSGLLRMNAVLSGSSQFALQTDSAITTDNTWVHVAVTQNGVSPVLYVNGVAVAQSFTNEFDKTAWFNDLSGLDVGNLGSLEWNSGMAVYFIGNIDEFGIWNRSLNSTEIDQLWNGGTGITYTGVFGTPPTVTLISPINDSNLTNFSVDFVTNVTDNVQVSNVTLYIDGVVNETNTSGVNGTYTFNVDIDEGIHNWSIIGVDNESSSTQSETRIFNLTHPLESMNVTLNKPDNATVQDNTTVDFNWTIAPTGVNTTNWTLTVWFVNDTIAHQHINTTIFTNETITVLHNDTLFFDESYVWNVESCGVGASSSPCDTSENRTFTIDTAPPIVNITSPPENFIVNNASQNITVNFTIIHPVGVLDSCWLNTSSNSTPIDVNCTSNVTYTLYPSSNPDNLTIYLSSNDTAGNTGSDNVTVIKNTVDPIVNITAPEEGFIVTQFNESIDLNWTIDTNGTLDSCWYNLGNSQKIPFADNGTLPTVLFDGNYSSAFQTLENATYQFEINDSFGVQNYFLNITNWDTWTDTFESTKMLSLENCTSNEINISSSCFFPGIGGSCTWSFFCGATYFGNATSSSGFEITNFISEIESYANSSYLGNNVSVNCSDNTTIINYPTENPDLVTINFFSSDTFGNTGSDNVTIFKSTVAPQINITSPVTMYDLLTEGQLIDLNFSVINATVLDECWFDYDNSNTTVDCDTENATNFTYVTSVNTITAYANDTLGNINSSTVTWTVDAVENNVTFNASTYETKTESFIVNISINQTAIVSVTSVLNYNGSRFTANTDCDGEICIIDTSIDLPLVTSGESETRDWFYEVTLFSALSQEETNTSTQTQNVSKIHLEICNATFTNQTLNFTAFDEQTLAVVDPFLFNADFEFWLGTGSVFRNNSFSQSSVSSVQLCIQPAAEQYEINGDVEYDEATGTNYTVRNYYFQNDAINSTSQDIKLGLLLADDSTSFILKVQDADILPLPDALIFTQRFYAGTGTFKTVQVGKTDDNGKTVGFFEAETGDYRFIIKKGGITLLITPDGGRSQKVVGEETPFTLTFTVGEDEGAAWQDYEPTDDLTSSLLYNTTTQIVSFAYEDTSLIFTSALLQVFLSNATGSDLLLCNNSLNQSSGILICNMTGNSTGSYIAKGIIFRDSSGILVEQRSFNIQDFASIADRLGLFLGWFIILIAALSFKFNEIAGILLTNAAMIFVNIIGLINFGLTWITAWVALSIIILVVLER